MVETTWKRLVRFVAQEDGKEYIGEPVDDAVDIGAAIAASEPVQVRLFSGSSVLDLGTAPLASNETRTISKLLAPISKQEIGTIRCVGLNYRNHAKEMNLALPDYPTLFFKPSICLGDPNADLVIPHQATDGQADYEAELAVVVGKAARNVSEHDAMRYVLGYICSNDVTARKHQFAGAQWSFGKGFDGFAPMGPCLVSASQASATAGISGDAAVVGVGLKTVLNGETVQEGKADDMIFSIAKIIAYLSQGSTLEPGTVIMTGTPAGIGDSKKPPLYLKDGDDLRVVMTHGLGSLVNKVVYEKVPEGYTNGVASKI